MDKQFPTDTFDYGGGAELEAESERLTRDRRGGPVTVMRSRTMPRARAFARARPGYRAPRALIRSRFPYLPFPQRLAQPSPGAYPRPGLRGPARTYPATYLPFPLGDVAGGCSCDAATSPVTGDAGAPSSVTGALASSDTGGTLSTGSAPAEELGSWTQRAAAFTAQPRRPTATAPEFPMASLGSAFAALAPALHFEAEDEADHEGPADAAGPRLATLKVVAKDRHGFSYMFTPDDLLWTARFLTGEAGGADNLDNAGVIWAMFNRFGLFTHSRYRTFHSFLRAYSTPLQRVLHSSGAARRHMHDPQFIVAGGNYPGTEVPRGQLRRFLELQDQTWQKLPQAARNLATRALRGDVPNPIGNATEFASTAVYYRDRYRKTVPDEATWRAFTERYAAAKHWTWVGDVPGLNQRNNAFFIDARAVALPTDAVRVAA